MAITNYMRYVSSLPGEHDVAPWLAEISNSKKRHSQVKKNPGLTAPTSVGHTAGAAGVGIGEAAGRSGKEAPPNSSRSFERMDSIGFHGAKVFLDLEQNKNKLIISFHASLEGLLLLSPIEWMHTLKSRLGLFTAG